MIKPKYTKEEIFHKLEDLQQLGEFDQTFYPEIDCLIRKIAKECIAPLSLFK